MKKILFYYKLFFAGGIESSILKLVRKLYKDYEIYVAYDDEDSQFVVLDRIAKYASIVNLNEIEQMKVDTCVWCSHPKQWSFEKFSSKIEAEKYYCWGHILLFDTYPDFEFDKKFMDSMDKFICVSNTVKNDILNKYPQLEKKSMVLVNYMDLVEIVKRSEEKSDISVDCNKLNIITTARIARDKGYKRMKTLCDVFDANDISYDWYILGKAFKQDVYDEITGIFKGNQNVHFLGYKENVYSYIKQMDYMAILSDREANNLSVSEALILGVPCIVSSFAGAEDQITDGKNGIILDINNSEERYQDRVDDIVCWQKRLKNNIKSTDQSKEYILDIWKSLL